VGLALVSMRSAKGLLEGAGAADSADSADSASAAGSMINAIKEELKSLPLKSLLTCAGSVFTNQQ
jgi:hypothetical protein